MTPTISHSSTEAEGTTGPCGANTDGETCIYIYGVGRCNGSRKPGAPDRVEELPPVEGVVPGASAVLFPVEELAAIISRAPVSAFASDAASRGDNDAEWAKARAVAHHRVLEALAPWFTLAPLKFGSICKTPADLIRLLTRHSGLFHCALNRVEGAREWGVKLHCDMEARRCAVSGSAPSLAPLRAELAASSPGMAFFVRKKLSEAASAEARQSLAVPIANVHGRLGAEAREAAVGRVQPVRGEHGGRSMIPIFNASYLVDRCREDRFHETLAGMGERLAPEGLAIAVTGPWPPYNFVSFSPEALDHE
jgi:hypothetical protein